MFTNTTKFILISTKNFCLHHGGVSRLSDYSPLVLLFATGKSESCARSTRTGFSRSLQLLLRFLVTLMFKLEPIKSNFILWTLSAFVTIYFYGFGPLYGDLSIHAVSDWSAWIDRQQPVPEVSLDEVGRQNRHRPSSYSGVAAGIRQVVCYKTRKPVGVWPFGVCYP